MSDEKEIIETQQVEKIVEGINYKKLKDAISEGIVEGYVKIILFSILLFTFCFVTVPLLFMVALTLFR